jgi:membrane protease YdiL (CAAX protease family)
MSISAARLGRPEGAMLGLLTMVVGVALLLARVQILSAGSSRASLLVAVYALLLGISLAPVLSRRSETAPLPVVAVIAVGMVVLTVTTVAPWQIQVPHLAGAGALGLGALAAVAEEAFFRRFLYARLLALGAGAAVVGSAVAFALVHVPLYGTSVLWLDLGAGALLSWQRWASGTWTAPAATHVFANVLAALR